MTIRMIQQLAPEAFHAVAEELGLADDLLMDAEVVFVEEAKAELARAQPILDRIGGNEADLSFSPEAEAAAEAFVRDWARNLMVKVLCRLETRPHDLYRALSA